MADHPSPNPRYSPPINHKGDRVIYDDQGGPVNAVDRITILRKKLAREAADERVLTWLETVECIAKLTPDDRIVLAKAVMGLIGRSVANDRLHMAAVTKQLAWRLSNVDSVPDPREDRIAPPTVPNAQVKAAPVPDVISSGDWGDLLIHHDEPQTIEVRSAGKNPREGDQEEERKLSCPFAAHPMDCRCQETGTA